MSSESDRQRGGLEARFWKLIEARCEARAGFAGEPGNASSAHLADIDARIWDEFGETWAILFTDLSGFSRHVAAFGILHFLQIIFEQKRLLLPIVMRHGGVHVKTEADSLLLIFERAEAAIRCAIEMQRACQAYSLTRAPEDRVLLCAGIGFGRILRIGDVDVYGQEVNAASKLGEDTARADEILVTASARAAADMEGVTYEALDHPVPGSDDNYRVLYAHS